MLNGREVWDSLKRFPPLSDKSFKKIFWGFIGEEFNK